MTDIRFSAPAMSAKEIDEIALAVRRLLGMKDPFLSVTDLLEFGLEKIAPGYTFNVAEREEMGERHGLVDTHEKLLTLRNDVYERMVAHQGRDRFTGCHEFGHALLHGRNLNRLSPGTSGAIFCDPEWQANTFASAILMPKHLIIQMRSVTEVKNEFGVSEAAAETRLRKLRVQLPKY